MSVFYSNEISNIHLKITIKLKNIRTRVYMYIAYFRVCFLKTLIYLKTYGKYVLKDPINIMTKMSLVVRKPVFGVSAQV